MVVTEKTKAASYPHKDDATPIEEPDKVRNPPE